MNNAHISGRGTHILISTLTGAQKALNNCSYKRFNTALCILQPLQYLFWACTCVLSYFLLVHLIGCLSIAFSALRSYALCPGPYRLIVSTAIFALALPPLFISMIVRSWLLHGNPTCDTTSSDRSTSISRCSSKIQLKALYRRSWY